MGGIALYDGDGPIGGKVIHDDDLQVFQALCKQAVEALGDIGFSIVCRYHYGDSRHKRESFPLASARAA
jgi:hypothetical protein